MESKEVLKILMEMNENFVNIGLAQIEKQGEMLEKLKAIETNTAVASFDVKQINAEIQRIKDHIGMKD